jgi:hypothetical protein
VSTVGEARRTHRADISQAEYADSHALPFAVGVSLMLRVSVRRFRGGVPKEATDINTTIAQT